MIVGSAVTLKANFTDAGTLDPHTCSFIWGDGTTSAGIVSETNGSGACTQTHTYANAGVYSVGVTVIDKDGGPATSKYEFVVVFEPTEGYVAAGLFGAARLPMLEEEVREMAALRAEGEREKVRA